MNAKITLALAGSLALFACKKELVPQDSSVVPVSQTAATPVPTPVAAPAATTAPVQQTAGTTAPVAAGMNPPHGQPNHRCDIAVGAPLNSPPGNKAPQPQAAAGKAITMQPAAAVKTAPGMNPPHGQPNHRCDIAVGAPLNSPVAKPAETQGKASIIARNPDGKLGQPVPVEAAPEGK